MINHTARERIVEKPQTTYMRQVLQEIHATPQEYLPSLLNLIRVYRQSIPLKPAVESFRQGWQEALSGDTLPIESLWADLEDGDGRD